MHFNFSFVVAKNYERKMLILEHQQGSDIFVGGSAYELVRV
jgi:hypothetical protein